MTAALCEESGISRKTGHKIQQRYRQIGVQGLTDRSRRPHRHANQLPLVVEEDDREDQAEYHRWGAPEIRERLRGRPRCTVPPSARCMRSSTV